VFVAEPAVWARLIERAKRFGEPDLIAVGGVSYRYRILETSAAVAGQRCPAGTGVVNTLYVFEGIPEQPGEQLYPARITAECISDFGALEVLSVDADVDGRILNTDLLRAGGTAIQHPDFNPSNRSAENLRLRTFLKDLVELFLRVP
jgi:hypothetical protein